MGTSGRVYAWDVYPHRVELIRAAARRLSLENVRPAVHDARKGQPSLELAMDGERIRNLAQNRLHMLRPERAETETIYIQTADSNRRQALQQDEEPKMELLDILLGLLNVLNIGE